MKIKHTAVTKLAHLLLQASVVTTTTLLLSNAAFAHHHHHHCKRHADMTYQPMDYKQEAGRPIVMWMPHWYVGANIGISDLHDNYTIGSVKETGPGGSVDAGYQFSPMWGVEAGYTEYYNSRNDLAGTNLAKTSHWSTDIAGTLTYPFGTSRWSALGKLGVAYSYARKDTPGGATASSGSVSPYGGLGLVYAVTQNVDFIGQWARAWGNHYTGSADLYSLGVQAALV